MKNIAFVIWMIGYPLTYSITDTISYYLNKEREEKISDNTKGWAAFLVLFTWVFVGFLLFEG